MGYNTTVVVMNDALAAIEKDPEFGKNLATAIRNVFGSNATNVPAGGHSRAALVIETHHADQQVIVRVGGNEGNIIQGVLIHYTSRNPERDLLTTLASHMGYSLHKKPERKKS